MFTMYYENQPVQNTMTKVACLLVETDRDHSVVHTVNVEQIFNTEIIHRDIAERCSKLLTKCTYLEYGDINGIRNVDAIAKHCGG